MKKITAMIVLTAVNLSVVAQVSKKSPLFIELQKKDSILFEEGFNKCNLAALENLLDSNFEFYHDQKWGAGQKSFPAGF